LNAHKSELQGCVTQNVCELGMHEYLLSQQYGSDMRVELEREVNYNAKVTNFAHSVNRLVVNTVTNVTHVDITQYNAGTISHRYR